MQWIKELKISILEEDELKIKKLIDTLPTFDSLQQMQEAAYMMKEAHNFLSRSKNDLAEKLIKIKKQKEFIHNISQKSSFDQHH